MDKIIMPNHVAIILDGNRRWAKNRNLTTLEGHQKGMDNIMDLTPYIINKGVKVLSVYAFSLQNFNRSIEEVNYLMNIFVKMMKKASKEIHNENIKVVFSGERDRLRPDVVEAMNYVEEKTKNNNKGIFNICLGYSSQQEIVDMVKDTCLKYKNGEVSMDEITTEYIQHNLYQDLPPVDFLIRTSGELRLSNYMLYQCSYAELYFPKVYFPDFNRLEFDKAIEEYNRRNRRFGV